VLFSLFVNFVSCETDVVTIIESAQGLKLHELGMSVIIVEIDARSTD